LNVFIVYFNIVINIIIGILPLNSHDNIFAMHTYLHVCFLLSKVVPFPTCSTSTLFSPVPIDPF
jgi:hypothetical protein